MQALTDAAFAVFRVLLRLHLGTLAEKAISCIQEDSRPTSVTVLPLNLHKKIV